MTRGFGPLGLGSIPSGVAFSVWQQTLSMDETNTRCWVHVVAVACRTFNPYGQGSTPCVPFTRELWRNGSAIRCDRIGPGSIPGFSPGGLV